MLTDFTYTLVIFKLIKLPGIEKLMCVIDAVRHSVTVTEKCTWKRYIGAFLVLILQDHSSYRKNSNIDSEASKSRAYMPKQTKHYNGRQEKL